MRRVVFLLGFILLVPVSARAQKASFEDLLADAQRVDDVAEIARPFVERCESRDEEERRQCEGSRRFLQGHLRSGRFATEVHGALDIAPFQLKTKSVPVTVRGCVTCDKAAEVEGGRVWVGATGAGRGELAKRQVAVPVEKIKEWHAYTAPQLRTQLIYSLSAKPAATAPKGALPLGIEVLGWRVFNRCTGEVLWSEPASQGKVATTATLAECPRPEQPKVVSKEPTTPDARPAKLGRYEIEQALSPMKDKAKACYDQYEVSGRADVVLDIQGDGTLLAAHVRGNFEGTPTARCLLGALGGLKFPAFKAQKQTVEYPFYLR
jgi:hypothetical protein